MRTGGGGSVRMVCHGQRSLGAVYELLLMQVTAEAFKTRVKARETSKGKGSALEILNTGCTSNYRMRAVSKELTAAAHKEPANPQ